MPKRNQHQKPPRIPSSKIKPPRILNSNIAAMSEDPIAANAEKEIAARSQLSTFYKNIEGASRESASQISNGNQAPKDKECGDISGNISLELPNLEQKNEPSSINETSPHSQHVENFAIGIISGEEQKRAACSDESCSLSNEKKLTTCIKSSSSAGQKKNYDELLHQLFNSAPRERQHISQETIQELFEKKPPKEREIKFGTSLMDLAQTLELNCPDEYVDEELQQLAKILRQPREKSNGPGEKQNNLNKYADDGLAMHLEQSCENEKPDDLGEYRDSMLDELAAHLEQSCEKPSNLDDLKQTCKNENPSSLGECLDDALDILAMTCEKSDSPDERQNSPNEHVGDGLVINLTQPCEAKEMETSEDKKTAAEKKKSKNRRRAKAKHKSLAITTDISEEIPVVKELSDACQLGADLSEKTVEKKDVSEKKGATNTCQSNTVVREKTPAEVRKKIPAEKEALKRKAKAKLESMMDSRRRAGTKLKPTLIIDFDNPAPVTDKKLDSSRVPFKFPCENPTCKECSELNFFESALGIDEECYIDMANKAINREIPKEVMFVANTLILSSGIMRHMIGASRQFLKAAGLVTTAIESDLARCNQSMDIINKTYSVIKNSSMYSLFQELEKSGELIGGMEIVANKLLDLCRAVTKLQEQERSFTLKSTDCVDSQMVIIKKHVMNRDKITNEYQKLKKNFFVLYVKSLQFEVGNGDFSLLERRASVTQEVAISKIGEICNDIFCEMFTFCTISMEEKMKQIQDNAKNYYIDDLQNALVIIMELMQYNTAKDAVNSNLGDENIKIFNVVVDRMYNHDENNDLALPEIKQILKKSKKFFNEIVKARQSFEMLTRNDTTLYLKKLYDEIVEKTTERLRDRPESATSKLDRAIALEVLQNVVELETTSDEDDFDCQSIREDYKRSEQKPTTPTVDQLDDIQISAEECEKAERKGPTTPPEGATAEAPHTIANEEPEIVSDIESTSDEGDFDLKSCHSISEEEDLYLDQKIMEQSLNQSETAEESHHTIANERAEATADSRETEGETTAIDRTIALQVPQNVLEQSETTSDEDDLDYQLFQSIGEEDLYSDQKIKEQSLNQSATTEESHHTIANKEAEDATADSRETEGETTEMRRTIVLTELQNILEQMEATLDGSGLDCKSIKEECRKAGIKGPTTPPVDQLVNIQISAKELKSSEEKPTTLPESTTADEDRAIAGEALENASDSEGASDSESELHDDYCDCHDCKSAREEYERAEIEAIEKEYERSKMEEIRRESERAEAGSLLKEMERAEMEAAKKERERSEIEAIEEEFEKIAIEAIRKEFRKDGMKGSTTPPPDQLVGAEIDNLSVIQI